MCDVGGVANAEERTLLPVSPMMYAGTVRENRHGDELMTSRDGVYDGCWIDPSVAAVRPCAALPRRRRYRLDLWLVSV